MERLQPTRTSGDPRKCDRGETPEKFQSGMKPWSRASLTAQLVKSPPAMQETLARFLGWDDLLEKGEAIDPSILGLPLWLSRQRICPLCRRHGFDPWVGKIPLEKGKATHSSILAWRLYSPWCLKESDTTKQLSPCIKDILYVLTKIQFSPHIDISLRNWGTSKINKIFSPEK